jgi:hypothetical protein
LRKKATQREERLKERGKDGGYTGCDSSREGGGGGGGVELRPKKIKAKNVGLF